MVKTSQLLKELQTKIVELEARINELEHPVKLALPAPAPKPVEQPTAQLPPAQPKEEPISEEIMLVIAAAVAAYLGERAHIRVVRLVPSHAWAQQGRVSIQASHHLT